MKAIKVIKSKKSIKTIKIKNPLNSCIQTYNVSAKLEEFEISPKNTIPFKMNRLLNNNIGAIEDKNRIFLGSLIYFFDRIPEFKRILKDKVLEIGVISTIPKQSGIGGSSSIIISLLWAIGCYCGFDKYEPRKFSGLPFNRDIIAELSTEIENKVLKNTAGYGDTYTISRGGIGFTSYVGKLQHPLVEKGPLAVYDRIDKTYRIEEIPIILAYPVYSTQTGGFTIF
ncbi:MAG: GHMP family kinase ATP-binding protein [Promethearchaeota archaeon]